MGNEGWVRGRENGWVRRGRVPDSIGQQRETFDGNVWARMGMQVDKRSGGVIGCYSRGPLSSGDAGQWEVELGDREVLERSVELSGAGRSPEVNEEAGRAESMSITGDAGVRGRERENIFQ